jgi:predicted dehydrogenase
MPQPTTRRRFLKLTASGAATLACRAVACHSEVPAKEPRGANDRLNMAAIGVGNRGEVNLSEVRSENIVALCDVDQRMLDSQQRKFPSATVYRDFRPLLERSDLDAVVISTPDHTHFHAASQALSQGLHVYCEKPLAHSVWEVRQLAQAAARSEVATQMGNQHHSSAGYLRVVDWVRSGRLGEIREVHSWTSRPIWPQGIPRPAKVEPVPAELDWNLWLGPAPERPFHSIYHPLRWRGWWDFGGGALADMGPHLLDPAFMALDLTLPTRISAESSEVNEETLPAWSIVRFEFPAVGERPGVSVIWYDGGKQPPASVTGTANPPPNGTLLVGSEASLFAPELGGRPLVIPPAGKPRPAAPDARDAADGAPIGHHAQWLRACRGGPPAGSSFDYAARLTETCLLGNIALRCGRTLGWNAQAMKFVDCPEAGGYLQRDYRDGWQLSGGTPAARGVER